MRYHLERSGIDAAGTYLIELWSTEPPQRCLCLLPADPERREEAERLARLLLAAANGVQRKATG